MRQACFAGEARAASKKNVHHSKGWRWLLNKKNKPEIIASKLLSVQCVCKQIRGVASYMSICICVNTLMGPDSICLYLCRSAYGAMVRETTVLCLGCSELYSGHNLC